MPRPLRLITALAFAQIVGCAIAVLLRDTGERVDVSITEGQLTQMPGAVFWACVALLVLAWAYLLAGALHAHPAIRLGALLLFGGAMYAGGVNASLAATQQWLAIAAFAGIWALALLTWVADRRAYGGWGERERAWVRGSTFAALLVLVGGIYAIAWWGAGAHGIPRLFTLGLSFQIAVVSLALIPVLLATAVEFAEWGELVGERAAHLLGRVRARAVLLIAAAAVAVAILAGVVDRAGVAVTLRQLVLGGILGAAVLLALRPPRAPRADAFVPWLAPIAAAVAIGGIFVVGSLASSSAESEARKLPVVGQLGAYEYPGPPRFSIEYPAAWNSARSKPDRKQATVTFGGARAGDPAVFIAVATLRPAHGGLLPPRAAELVGVLNPGNAVQLGTARRDGPWTKTPFTMQKRGGPSWIGTSWTRVDERYHWLLLGYGIRQLDAINSPVFAEMTKSWRTAPPAHSAESAEADTRASSSHAGEKQEGADASDRILAFAAAFSLLAALAAGWALRARWRPLDNGRVHAAALFVLVAGVAFALTAVPQVWIVLFGPPPDWVSGLRISGFQVIVAVATLAAVGVAVVRQRDWLTRGVAALLALCVGLQILAWFMDLFIAAIEAGRVTIVAALILLLSLLWDLATSGDAVTNGHGRVFPRAARVMLYCGYIALTAAVVAYFSSLHSEPTGNGIEALFETDRWPRLGIQLIGAPMLMTGFLLSVLPRRKDHPEPHP